MTLRIHGRRRLKRPPEQTTRPTSGRVRQSVFGIVQNQIEGSRWLDLCSGAGTIGGEALSRGADRVVGVEISSRACAVIRENWTNIARPGQTFEVIKGDVGAVLGRLPEEKFDIVYLDPPYDSEIYTRVLEMLPRFVAPGGIVMVEHRKGKSLPVQAGALIQHSRRQYGQSEISIYRLEVSSRKNAAESGCAP